MPEGLHRSPLLATLSAFALTGLAHSVSPDFSENKTSESITKILDDSPDVKKPESKVAPLRVQTHWVDSEPLWGVGELNWDAATELLHCSDKCELVDQWVPGYEDLVGVDCEDSWVYVGPIYKDPSHWILLDSSSIDLSDYLHFEFEVWNYAAEWDDERGFDENLEQACELIQEAATEEPEMCGQLKRYLDEIEAADLYIDRAYIENKCGDVELLEFSAGFLSYNQSFSLECGLSLTDEGVPVSFWCSRNWRVPYLERGEFFVLGGGQFDVLPSAQEIRASLASQDFSYSLPRYSLDVTTNWTPELIGGHYDSVDTGDFFPEFEEKEYVQDTGFSWEAEDSGGY